ncbi:MAG: metal-dependent hydrolase [Chloroflexi bacterium]|nr:metal-dependent hydrolase [Chloroflexota bacterium]
MPQAGMHALVGAAMRRITPPREWLLLGVILGSMFPDLDNYAVAVATLMGRDTHGLHRTFTHSVFTILTALIFFYLIGGVRRQPRWTNLGVGFAAGIGLHILLDLLIWFNGVEVLWPLGGLVNLWEGISPPEWFARLLDPAEFLFAFLYFAWLAKTARARRTDAQFLPMLRRWTIAMLILLVVFTPLAFLMSKGFLTIFGAFYLIMLTAAFVITLRMRQTVEAL